MSQKIDLNPDWQDIDEILAQAQADAVAVGETQPEIKPFHVLSAKQLLTEPCPPRVDILGEAIFFERSLTSLVAPPGTGKSRAIVQMAIAAILGKEFGPLRGTGHAAKWIFLSGNENSRQRYRKDLEGLLKPIPEAQRHCVLDRLFFQIVESIDDTMTPSTMDRVEESVRQTGAGVVIVDPLGDVLSGDSNADLDVRASLRTLTHAVWKASPKACICLVHHARTGRANISQAVGYDRGNYGKGSKAVYAACRSVVNMAPGDSEDTSKVVFSCGKCNDAQPFVTFGMVLTEGVYEVDTNFDPEAWKADVDGKRTGKTFTVQDILDFIGNDPKKGVTQSELRDAFCPGTSRATISRRVTEGIKTGHLRTDRNDRIFSSGKKAAQKPVSVTFNTVNDKGL